MVEIRGILRLSVCEFFTVCCFQWIVVTMEPQMHLQVSDDEYDDGRCQDTSVKQSVLECNPDLSLISTLILQTSGSNYSHICRAFDDYLECMEPKVVGCKSVLLLSYDINKGTYSAPPYNCSLPVETIQPTKAEYNSTNQGSGCSHMSAYDHIWIFFILAMLISHRLITLPT